ncbi:uncharacterized protein B4U80_03819 [Leptotrombidium deliense]|uniref:Uncharacterized protein n=1 Tax=Leptotrombidium deliense TaxID=299467 RepID=A0A443SE45_9ACAR|nr:uncharacterized protein B4U80_03819 [Leptotrombidium deliense]
MCRLSKEDRRTQPQAFRQLSSTSRDYLENQCAAAGPTTCLYNTKRDVGVITMDSLIFALNLEDCQIKCDKESTFNCRSFSIADKRCFLSGDDTVSLSNTALPLKAGSVYGEKKCVTEHCVHGIFTYEKITGYVLRSAASTPIETIEAGKLGITGYCREHCDNGHLACPAFTVNYQSSRCDKMDRNTQGRALDLIPRDGENYFEKICLRVPEIMSMCQDKFWAFERVIGYELTPVMYERVYTFVQSRRDCEEYCLQEKLFVCRSALYNDENTECKLSREDRRSKPASYVRNNNPKISYLENQCIPSHSKCPLVEFENGYPTYTDIVETIGVTSKESCEKYCNDNRRFLCRSFSYYSSNGQCFISGDDHVSGGQSALQPRSGMTYYERKCERFPDSTTTEDTSSTTSTTDTTGKETSKSETGGITGGVSSTTVSTAENTIVSTNNVDHTTDKQMPPSSSGLVSTSEAPTTATYPSTISSLPSSAKEPTSRTTTLSSSHFPSSNTGSVKCGANSRFIFERIPGFEPIGGYLMLLYSDTGSPGIVPECARRCEVHTGCRAFVIDYNRRSCNGLFERSSVGLLDLRLSRGKDYFEGFCVDTHLACKKLWVYDRVLDQKSVGVQPKSIVRFVHRTECRNRCLEEKRFPCLSASYDATLRECRLYDQDRHTGSLFLKFTKGTDYMENQCASETDSCKYLPIERDVTITSVTKSVRGSSTFFCEQECNREKEFNCRSYTYIDHTTIPGANICLLSSDNRAGSQKGSMHYRPRALYGEKDCRGNRKGRGSTTIVPEITPTHSQHPVPDSSFPSIHTQLPGRRHCNYNEFTFEKTFGYDLRFAKRERSRLPPRIGIVAQCQDECLRRGSKCQSFVIDYGTDQNCFLLDGAAQENRKTLSKSINVAYFEKICLIGAPTCGKVWTFERVIGYTFEETPEKESRNVETRQDCEEICLRTSCRSLTYEYPSKICKTFTESRRSKPAAFKPTSKEIDYIENECIKELKTCQYRDYPETFFPFVDRLTHAFSLSDCQRQCNEESTFICRTVNYESYSRECAMCAEDRITASIGQSPLQQRRNTIYSERAACEQVSVQCTQQEMMVTLNFDAPFIGRVYVKGNPAQCFVLGKGENHIQFPISLGIKCGTRQEGPRNFANEIIIQQHPIIMTDSDRSIKVMCSFETVDQTVTLSSASKGKSGIDVTSVTNARTSVEHPISSVVTNTAPPPSVVMRILDRSGHDAQIVGLGDELTLKIELRDPATAFAIFARNLYARSSNGESLLLIDNTGCPKDAAVFPPLKIDSRDRKSLLASFKAFRFPSTGVVNFEVQIRFCQDVCEPVKCFTGLQSYGRKKRNVLTMSSTAFIGKSNQNDSSKANLSLEEALARRNRSAVQHMDATVVKPRNQHHYH